MSDDIQLTFSAAEKKLLREKYAKLNDTEFDAFLSAAVRYRLNPLANQIYARLTPQTDKNPRSVVYMTQIDGYRLMADRTGAYAGGDEPIYAVDDDERKATVTVYKMVDGQRCAFTASAWWSEFYPGQKQGFMWDKMPHLMLGKCAEALALRRAFPAELSGLYTQEEMDQAGPEPEANPAKEQNPFRQSPPKSKAKKDPPAKPLQTAEGFIVGTKTPRALIALLASMRDQHPVPENPAKWKAYYGVAVKHMNEKDWQTGEDADELHELLHAIAEGLDLAEQGQEAFSK